MYGCNHIIFNTHVIMYISHDNYLIFVPFKIVVSRAMVKIGSGTPKKRKSDVLIRPPNYFQYVVDSQVMFLCFKKVSSRVMLISNIKIRYSCQHTDVFKYQQSENNMSVIIIMYITNLS